MPYWQRTHAFLTKALRHADVDMDVSEDGVAASGSILPAAQVLAVVQAALAHARTDSVAQAAERVTSLAVTAMAPEQHWKARYEALRTCRILLPALQPAFDTGDGSAVESVAKMLRAAAPLADDKMSQVRTSGSSDVPQREQPR